MSVQIAAPEVIVRWASDQQSRCRENSIFMSKNHLVHTIKCFECRAEIRYARAIGEKPDARRRCCDCMSAWWSLRKAREVQS